MRRESAARTPDLPIREVLEHYGGDVPDVDEMWVGMRCPFHEDRRASARVNETGFACLGCSVKGNAVSLIKEVEKCEWGRAFTLYEEITGRKLSNLQRSTSRKFGGDLPPREGDYEERSGFFPSRLRRGARAR